MSKYISILFLITNCLFLSCEKELVLEDLMPNPWEQPGYSFITIDTSLTYPITPSNGNLTIYFSFNQVDLEARFEEKITEIKGMYNRSSFPVSSNIRHSPPSFQNLCF